MSASVIDIKEYKDNKINQLINETEEKLAENQSIIDDIEKHPGNPWHDFVELAGLYEDNQQLREKRREKINKYM